MSNEETAPQKPGSSTGSSPYDAYLSYLAALINAWQIYYNQVAVWVAGGGLGAAPVPPIWNWPNVPPPGPSQTTIPGPYPIKPP